MNIINDFKKLEMSSFAEDVSLNSTLKIKSEMELYLSALPRISVFDRDEKEEIKEAFERDGVVFVENCVSKQHKTKYLEWITRELSAYLGKRPGKIRTETQIHDRIRELSKEWNSKNFGNASFRFFFPTRLSKQDQEKFTENIDGDEVYFAYNPIHKHNVRLLHDTGMFDTLKSLHKTQERCIVSWDSAKIRCNARGSTKPALTKIHTDTYDIDRIQAMFIFSHNSVPLGFIPRTNSPKFVSMTKSLKSKGKFSMFKDKDINKILINHLQYPDPKKDMMVIWDEGIVHAEVPGRYDLKDVVIRSVVGTQMTKIPQSSLRIVAKYAENSFCPAVYDNRNKNNIIGRNTVSKKKTSYNVPRKIRKISGMSEKQIFDAKLSGVQDNLNELYGI